MARLLRSAPAAPHLRCLTPYDQTRGISAGRSTTMQHETLTYQADGLTMRSQLFFEPGSGRRAGVLVFPEAFGLGEHAISPAERLAKAGFVALACDLHGDGRVVNDLQEAVGLLQPMLADASKTR